MIKIKLLFITVLAFSSAMSFAGATEEENELKSAILQPIIEHFPKDSSYTRKISNAIVEHEVSLNKQLNRDQVAIYLEELLDSKPFEDPEYKCAWDTHDMIDDRSDSADFAERYLSAWRNNMGQCYDYARLALVAFYFNMMNYKAAHPGIRPIFKEASLVETVGDTGHHLFMLVEGDSGTIFAVDPWIRQVKVVPGFTKFSVFMSDEERLVHRLGADDNGRLNLLFSQPYYDVRYVYNDTQWRLQLFSTNKVREMAESGCPNIKTLYDTLKFPRWQTDYNILVKSIAKKSSSRCSLQ